MGENFVSLMISRSYKIPHILNYLSSANAPYFYQLYRPIQKAMMGMSPLEARGHRPLKMTFEDQLKALTFFHLEEHTSAQHLLQVLEEDIFARNVIAPEVGIKEIFTSGTSLGEIVKWVEDNVKPR